MTYPSKPSIRLSKGKIAIAGGGLLGRLLAWQLNLLEHDVTLFESGSVSASKSAAFTAAAMISPVSEVVVSEKSIYDIGIYSIEIWKQWIDALPVEFQSLFSHQGSLVVAHPQDEAELLQFQQDLNFHLQHTSKNAFTWLDRHALKEAEPDIADHFNGGVWLPNEAHLDNREFLTRLLALAKRQGLKIVENAHVSLSPHPSVNNQVMSQYDLIIDCRGLGSRVDNENIRGVRGEVLWIECAEVNFSRPIRLMHPRYKLYIVPKSNQQFIIGATEIESEDSSPISVQSALELCSALYTLNPAFAEARIIELDANLRPSTLDNMPYIYEHAVATATGEKQRIISINGLYRHGYLLAPTLVEHTLGVIDGQWDLPFLNVLLREF